MGPLEPQIPQSVSMEPQILQTNHTPQKWPILTTQNEGQKKHFPESILSQTLYKKKRIQIGHFWPLCAIFLNQGNQEI